MAKRVQSFSFVAVLLTVVAIRWCASLQAQETQSPSGSQAQQNQNQPQQPPDTQAPEPQQPKTSQSPSQTQQTPDQGRGSQGANQSQTNDPSAGATEFIGTIAKQGNKYVFQDAASGQTYDIDHQDQVQKFEGKKVRVHGTLDSATKTIHVQ